MTRRRGVPPQIAICKLEESSMYSPIKAWVEALAWRKKPKDLFLFGEYINDSPIVLSNLNVHDEEILPLGLQSIFDLS